MRVGIVGSEGRKFTPHGEARARQIIRLLLAPEGTVVVSGHCHLGGIDIWAEEEAEALGREMLIYPPKKLNWNEGYKPRNMLIATSSDIVHCITVDSLPGSFKGMRFSYCYHCGKDDHVKSGGCWTMKRAKRYQLHIVENHEILQA